MVPEGAHAGFDEERDALLAPAAPVYSDDDGPADGEGLPLCKSFMHLHLGVRADAMPPDLPPQWTVVNSWDVPIDAPGNVIVVSVPSILDPSLAPEGHHVLHAYVPATEPYSEWEGLNRNSAEYRAKKAEAAEVLWRAVERQIPDVRERATVTMVGTPLTHERFLRRDAGTYGPFLRATDGQLPGPKLSACDGLLCCGDSTFPGIGMPAVAASGMLAAHSILSVRQHLQNLDKLKLPPK
mmetsp:Transcript_25062/g.83337  ORF Transcript_25062/g.83337 Transcript_25062/m.83337 type:complete len:239 (+) Transcript_25062:1369-2085(+)